MDIRRLRKLMLWLILLILAVPFLSFLGTAMETHSSQPDGDYARTVALDCARRAGADPRGTLSADQALRMGTCLDTAFPTLQGK
jgi:hypothetical protein